MLDHLNKAERLAKGVVTGQLGLLRSLIGGHSRRLATVFDNLLNHPDSKTIALSADHRTMAARVEVARNAGHGRWDFYCLGGGTFLIAGDSLFDRPCVEQIRGETPHYAMRFPPGPQPVSAEDLRRLDVARQIVVTQHAPPPLIGEIARRIGMGETKL